MRGVGVVVIRLGEQIPARTVEATGGRQIRVRVEKEFYRPEHPRAPLQLAQQLPAQSTTLHRRTKPQVLDLEAPPPECSDAAAPDSGASYLHHEKCAARRGELVRVWECREVAGGAREGRGSEREVLGEQGVCRGILHGALTKGQIAGHPASPVDSAITSMGRS